MSETYSYSGDLIVVCTDMPALVTTSYSGEDTVTDLVTKFHPDESYIPTHDHSHSNLKVKSEESKADGTSLVSPVHHVVYLDKSLVEHISTWE